MWLFSVGEGHMKFSRNLFTEVFSRYVQTTWTDNDRDSGGPGVSQLKYLSKFVFVRWLTSII
jgi:hypothetical protein